MKEYFNKMIQQFRCSHMYEFQSTYNERRLAQPHSENPFWYTEVFVQLKCSKCDKHIERTYDWCKDNNLPAHKSIGRMNSKRKGGIKNDQSKKM